MGNTSSGRGDKSRHMSGEDSGPSMSTSSRDGFEMFAGSYNEGGDFPSGLLKVSTINNKL